MLNSSTTRFSPSNLWIAALWFSLLLIPLLRLIPNPGNVTGNPWKVELFAAFFLFLAMFWALLKKIRLEINLPVLIPFLLFIAWSGISFFWAESAQAVAHHTLVWTSYLLFYCFFLHLLKSHPTRATLFAGLSIAFLIIAFSSFFDLLTIVDFAEDEGHFRTRYARYAEVLAMLSPLFWALSLQVGNRKKQFIFLVIGVVFWLGVMFSLSKGAFLAGICAFAVFFAASLIFSKKVYDRRKIAVLLAVWLVITCASQISFTPNSNTPTTTDYISGNADKSRNTTLMRIFTWKIAWQMFADHPLQGVGADNFGLEFRNSRINYAAANPNDELLAIAEDYMVERAHNEFLQIFAELGIVGAMIFLSLAGGFLFLLARAFAANGYRFSPLLWACLAGFCGFFVSSMFSSFSFRVVQNGIVFFFVLALATFEMQKIFRKRKKPQPRVVSLRSKPALALSFGFASLFFVFALCANLSNFYVLSAEKAEDFAVAEDFYRQALRLNPRNASAYFSYGQNLYFKKQPEKAVSMLEKAIANGLDASIAYSYLASAHTAAQNAQAAEETIAEALRIYPRSIFLRVRYAALLEKKGATEKSGEQMEIARRLDDRQANGWRELINSGAPASALKARNDEKITAPHNLLPTGALYAVLDEQAVENRFPRNSEIAANER